MANTNPPATCHIIRLSNELLDMVFDYLRLPAAAENVRIRLQDSKYGGWTAEKGATDRAWKSSLVTLAHAAVLSKKLYGPATRALYSKYAGQDIASLDKFLDSLRQRPSLSGHVLSATYIPGQSYDSTKRRSNYDDLALLLSACPNVKILGIYEPIENGQDCLQDHQMPQIANIDRLIVGNLGAPEDHELIRRYGFGNFTSLTFFALHLWSSPVFVLGPNWSDVLLSSLPATVEEISISWLQKKTCEDAELRKLIGPVLPSLGKEKARLEKLISVTIYRYLRVDYEAGVVDEMTGTGEYERRSLESQ